MAPGFRAAAHTYCYRAGGSISAHLDARGIDILNLGTACIYEYLRVLFIETRRAKSNALER